MKTAIYIENGVTQLVLTPQNEWETSVLRGIEKGKSEAQIYFGGFYACQGGWHRQDEDQNSLMVVVKNMTPTP